jgi:hypothetical protein
VDLLEVLVHLERAAMAGPRTHRLSPGHGHIELVSGDESGIGRQEKRQLDREVSGIAIEAREGATFRFEVPLIFRPQ